MKLTLGFSPCPNDTFIFDALVNGRLDTGDLRFDVLLEDVETLNQWALEGKPDISKLSFPAFFRASEQYVLLEAGGAMGKGVGPLLVSRDQKPYDEAAVNQARIALPGENTTAHWLFSLFYPAAPHKEFMLFSRIEEAVVNGEADLGVIIHENRFTYQQKGLHRVMDLGEAWEEKMQLPIPLGGIAIKRSLGPALRRQVQDLIRKSLAVSFAAYPSLSEYVKQHSQTMSEEVMRKHINLYVNDFTRDPGAPGKAAITALYEIYLRQRAFLNKPVKRVSLFS